MATRNGRIRRITASGARATLANSGMNRNFSARQAGRGMSLSYRGGDAGGYGGTSQGNRTALGGRGGRGTTANRAYRAAAIRALRGGATIAQANRSGYRASRASSGMSGG